MKKLIMVLLALLVGSSTIECTRKKVNKASEFLKGTVAFSSAIGLAYLAYTTPVKTIEQNISSAVDKIAPAEIGQWIKANCLSKSSWYSWSRKNSTKDKIFSFLTIIPAYELAKYGIKKFANCCKSYEKVPSKQQ